MLNEVVLFYIVVSSMCQDLVYYVYLMVVWKKQCMFVQWVFGFIVKVDKVLQDIGQVLLCEDFLLQIGGFVFVWIGWVVCIVVVFFVERKEKCFFVIKFCCYVGFICIDGEMDDIVAEL